MQRVTRWVDPTYLRNRLVCISLSQSSFIGEEFQTDPSGLPPVFPRDQCERWDVDALRGAAAQHPHQRGLWIFPGALSPDACADITSAVERLTGGHRVQGEQGVPVRAAAEQPPPAAPPAEEAAWEWLSYGHARWMVPLQPAGGVCDAFARGPLSELHSHGCTDARSWPSLGSLACDGGEALRALEGLPASAMADGFRGRPPLFLQLQRLQRGASTGVQAGRPSPHTPDAPRVPFFYNCRRLHRCARRPTPAGRARHHDCRALGRRQRRPGWRHLLPRRDGRRLCAGGCREGQRRPRGVPRRGGPALGHYPVRRPRRRGPVSLPEMTIQS
mmetsp:Transcript_12344/g.41417  ORF Transcript_12344/g.41417 Transcript_12344/m.41417 type:complete len:330 (+) Transcript_12344:50-1039(+)